MTANLTVVPAPAKKRQKVQPKQVTGIENPARVMLTPVLLGAGTGWWSYDKVLVGGIEAKQISNGDHLWATEPLASNIIGYQPMLVPAVWGEKDFHVVFEYEGEHPDAAFFFKVHYGCGDPSELHVRESAQFQGSGGAGKARLAVKLKHVDRVELLRVTLQILRRNGLPVIVYGAWLEIGLDSE